MPKYTEKELAAMTLEMAANEISNAVYLATGLIEKLERAGKVNGNGHHARQHLAKVAEEEMRMRWRG